MRSRSSKAALPMSPNVWGQFPKTPHQDLGPNPTAGARLPESDATQVRYKKTKNRHRSRTGWACPTLQGF
jgi:hypothetical protein